jgi:NYN domain
MAAAASDQGPTRSALFVDFDNVYIGLRNLDPDAARRFAADPRPWLAWIEEGMPGREDPRLGDLGDRLVLIRRCYLNPVAFADHRPVFTRAGFTVIDCPPLTAQGKTSTDIHMVMDILDTLRDYAHVSEYIVLSGDADFTPVLLRLRAHDRRTVVLPVGPAAAAFRASADRVLAENDFVDIALGERPSELEQVDTARSAEPRDTADDGPLEPDLADFRQDLLDEVRRIVDAAPRAMRLAAVAHDVRAKFKAAIDETDWARAGSFTGLLRSADYLGLAVTPGGGGYIYDPARHEPPPDARPDPLPAIGEQLGPLVTRISQVTDTPILTGEQYRHVFEALADHLRSAEYAISPTSKAVRDACGELGDRTSRQSINFILKGIAYRNGFRPGSAKDAASLASVYADNVLGLAAAAQLRLTDEERTRVVEWLTGGLR